ncbi:hypothetical protein BCR33DRAFT_358520 [Rhizoclosmatium globosum]|uniref:Uncharacterized protein n=1 Tax=Rhizoclosmatium globosum TaxID=329046 RepID=A0A1Y2C162_9FUNG|nr:hypothetical protein BCR33DRAFT_358520 [Rhizoclosmatium globosum]|eukprot:ORY40783.1 hypothetical protein BCR33DRAFT_358520 [Rhizoclosmatium globosum]
MSTTEDLMTADTVPASPVLGAKGAVRADRLYTEKELEDGIDEDHTSLEPDATDVSQSADDSPVEDEDVDMEPSLEDQIDVKNKEIQTLRKNLSETIAMIDLKDKTLDLNNERLVAAEAKAETLEVALESLKKENKKNIKKFEDTYASYKLKKDALADAIKDNEKALDEIGFFETNCKALREQVSVLKTKVKVQEEHLQSYAATLDSTQQELDDLYSSRKRQRDATVVLDSDGEPIDETPLPLPADKRATTTSTATPTKEESRKTSKSSYPFLLVWVGGVLSVAMLFILFGFAYTASSQSSFDCCIQWRRLLQKPGTPEIRYSHGLRWVQSDAKPVPVQDGIGNPCDGSRRCCRAWSCRNRRKVYSC